MARKKDIENQVEEQLDEQPEVLIDIQVEEQQEEQPKEEFIEVIGVPEAEKLQNQGFILVSVINSDKGKVFKFKGLK